MAAMKVAQTGVKREAGYLYYLDKQGDVSRVVMARGGGRQARTRPEKVADSSKVLALANARVESCVLRMFNRLHFPSADKPTSANWPLVFRPGK